MEMNVNTSWRDAALWKIKMSAPAADEAHQEAIGVDTEPVPLNDNINHPAHYADGFSNGAEVIDITENLNFNRGNAVKYLARAGRKDPDSEIEDILKAQWYLNREIERLEVNGYYEDGQLQLEQENMSLRKRVDELTGEGINYSHEVKDLRHQVQYANDRIKALLDLNARLRKSLERVRKHNMELAIELGESNRAD